MYKRNIIDIIKWEKKQHPNITLKKALDIFSETVENYKNATKRKRLNYVAKCFLDACLIASLEPLTGSQAFEVFNNIATDFDTDKDTVERKINKIIDKGWSK